jgi:hypothetical protein
MVLAVVGLTICLVATWGTIVYSRAGRLSNWLTLPQISERVRADLQIGTPLPEIERYFASNQIGHSYVERTNELYAMIYRIWGSGLLIQRDAWIRIDLDKDRRLKGVKVELVATGP